MHIYLASPLGFSEAGRYFYEKALLPHLRELGHEVIDPWTLTDVGVIATVRAMSDGVDRKNAWRRLNSEIAANNLAGIDRADIVLAILDGVDVDSGTAAEIGYAFARGIPIVGYRGDLRLCGDNEGATINLQVEYFIRQGGGRILTALAQLAKALANMKKNPARVASGPS